MGYNDLFVVSVGINGKENYADYALKLKASLNSMHIQNKIWINEYPVGSPSHQNCPYAFKYFAIKDAVNKGYKKVLWLDSVCKICGNTNELMSILESKKYFLPPDGWYVGQWCKDDALAPLEITREESFTIPVLAAKHMAFNFNDERNVRFLERFKYFIDYDSGNVLRGSWTNGNKEVSQDSKVLGHRHDQTVLSVIAHKFGMLLDGSLNEMIVWHSETKPRQVIRVK